MAKERSLTSHIFPLAIWTLNLGRMGVPTCDSIFGRISQINPLLSTVLLRVRVDIAGIVAGNISAFNRVAVVIKRLRSDKSTMLALIRIVGKIVLNMLDHLDNRVAYCVCAFANAKQPRRIRRVERIVSDIGIEVEVLRNLPDRFAGIFLSPASRNGLCSNTVQAPVSESAR